MFERFKPNSTYKNEETEMPVVSDAMLTLLEQQHDNFPILKGLVVTKSITSSSLFLPQVLKIIDHEFTNDMQLLLDCYSYLDIISVFSLSVYGDTNYYLDQLVESVSQSRTIKDPGQTLALEALDDFVYTTVNSASSLKMFLENNKLICAIYVYALVHKIFFKNQE